MVDTPRGWNDGHLRTPKDYSNPTLQKSIQAKSE